MLWLIFCLWNAHYLNRSLIYPIRTKTGGKQIPIAIVASAIFFNTVNGSINGYYLGSIGGEYPENWWYDGRFIIGLLLFIAGAWINIWSDNKLLALRKPGESGYHVPRGGMFEWVSCPNHLGEIIEWTGFAILCWNLPALSFAIWTAANLIPRSWSHHQWYRRYFPHYPAQRKAVLPRIL